MRFLSQMARQALRQRRKQGLPGLLPAEKVEE